MPQLYLDCDGVLADFESGALELLGMSSTEYTEQRGPGAFWKRLATAKDFYGQLQPLPDAMELFRAVEHLQPIILTGLPIGKWAEPQKRAWGEQYFPEVEMITTTARKKSTFCEPGDVLVDDRDKYRGDWENAGGIFILHTDARSTIEELMRLGWV